MISESQPTNQEISASWLSRPATEIAPDILGCILARRMPDGEIVRGTIVETEAYEAGDPACHAYRKRTPRNSVMFGAAGKTYVYLIYGIYHCLNVVTDVEGTASAVLIRALQLEDIPSGLKGSVKVSTPAKLSRIAAGPGKLCQVLQIDLSLTGRSLHSEEPLWLEHRSPHFQHSLDMGKTTFVQTTRIGLTQGTELPWRWYVSDCPAVSKL
jgi:DNA-3-methyladenine glycosylase